MLMVRKRVRLMVRRIIIAKEEPPFRILAMIAVFGFCQLWFGSDKFHDKKLETLGKHDSSLHEADMRSTLFLDQSRLHHLRTRSEHLFQVDKILLDQQTSVSFSK